MKGKNILVTAACVIGFGGIIGNTLVGVATSRELKARINNVEKNAKEADERYDASTRQELTNLINQTRDSITNTFQAAQQGMQASVDEALAKIEEAKAELARDLEGEMDSKDAALRTQLVNQLNTLAQQIAGTLTSLGNDVAALDAAQQQMATTLADIADRTEELEGKVEDLEGTMGEVIDFANQIANFAVTLNTKLNQTNQVLTELQSNLAANYYTAAQVNEFVTAISNSLNTLTSFFMVGGSVKTMQALVDEMSVLGGDMESFNGDEATAAKAQYVEELFAIIAAYDNDVNNTYNQIVTGYNHQSLAVPGAITTMKDNLLASAGLAALKDKMMVAMTKIILAPTKEDAKAVRDLYAGGVEYEIDALRFELDRINASNAIYDLITDGSLTYNFTDAEFNFFNDVMAYVFDNGSVDIEERAQYYTDAKADLAFRVEQAKGLKSLQAKLNARYAAISAFNDGVRLTNGSTVAPYLAIVDDLAKVATYKDAIAELDGTELVLSDADKIAAYVDAVDADASVVEYAADKYETLLQQQKSSDDVVAAFDDTVLAASVKTTITEAIALAVKDTDYQAALAAARGDDTLETVDARKAAIDDYIAAKVADCKYEQACAQYLFDVKTAAIAADTYIDGQAQLTANQKDVLKGQYAAANVPALADLYTTTGKGTADQYSTDEEWAALLQANTAQIDAVKQIALAQEGLMEDRGAKLGLLGAAAGEAGLPADVVALEAQFVSFLDAVLANYTFVTDTEIVGLTAENGVEAIAAATTDALTEAYAANGLALNAYKDYIALVKAADDLNEHITAYMAAFNANFYAGKNYNLTDADDVWDAHATERASLANDYTQAHGGAADTLPVYAFDDTKTYAEQKAELDAFYEALAPALQGIADKTAEFDTKGAQLEETMKEEFATKEAARLAANKEAFKNTLDATYAKVVAALDNEVGYTSTDKTVALAYYESCVNAINSTTRSNEPELRYLETFRYFATEAFHLADDADPTDPNYKTAEQKLEAILATY